MAKMGGFPVTIATVDTVADLEPVADITRKEKPSVGKALLGRLNWCAVGILLVRV